MPAVSSSISCGKYLSVFTSVISKKEFYAATSEQFVEETFGGSLPAFIAAFTSGKKLTKQEVDEIQKMIDKFKNNETFDE